ncbi:GAF and ANTAR domain-containing protein [Amycolatopsis nigrescens]|uniref:GAF and ANTAR domain-containing protein n=1 Tax=Amycolatopsis nigrescens TaxID=381445 RepID=UPI00039BC9CA|nr:GAF and ANTAR domain-containing protein [Amycolatopsis nigrescens]
MHSRKGQAIALVSDGSRIVRVWNWLSEHAAAKAVVVSPRVLCDAAVHRLTVSGAALTLANGSGWPELKYATDALAGSLAELQVTTGEGPSVDAADQRRPVLVSDLGTSAGARRWPLFAPLAVDAGARAVFALPLCIGAIPVGVLTLHQVEVGSLGSDALANSVVFADLALRLLLDEQAGRPVGDGVPDGDGLPLNSPQVHQATGMVAGQLGVSMEDAFARLRARAFTDQRTLTELATDVVTRRIRFSPEETPA